jgi:hypothetical protein
LTDTPPPPADRFRAAAFVFAALGIEKLIFFFRTVGDAMRTKNVAATGDGIAAFMAAHPRELLLVSAVLYFLSGLLSFLIAKGVSRRLPPALTVGMVYACLQVASIFTMHWTGGIVAILNFVLGFMAIINLLLARSYQQHPQVK